MTNQTPAPFQDSKPLAQLLIFLGFTCIALFLLMLAMALMQSAGIISLDAINTASFNNPQSINQLKILQIVSSVVVFIFPVLVLTVLVSRTPLNYLQLNHSGKISVLLVGGIVMLVASPLINFLAQVNNQLQLPHWMHGIEAWMKDSEATDDALTTAFLNHQTFYDLLVNLIMIALVAAICEELFFRAVMQKILIKWTKNTHAGIWITGAIFSAIHFQFYGFLPRMLMGVYLGYLLVWSGSLWVTIFAHFLNNATAVVIAFLADRKILSDSADKIGSQSSEFGLVIISAALVILLIMLIYRLSGKAKNLNQYS